MSYEDDIDNDTPLVKQLRSELKERDKLINQLNQKVQEFEDTARVQTLQEKIQSLGLNPKIAKIVPKDLKPDEVDEWLADFGDVFGGQPADQQADPNAAVAAEASRMAAAQQGASSGNPGDPLTRINEAKNWDELQEVLRTI